MSTDLAGNWRLDHENGCRLQAKNGRKDRLTDSVVTAVAAAAAAATIHQRTNNNAQHEFLGLRAKQVLSTVIF